MAGLLDLLGETARLEVSLNAEASGDCKGVGGRGVGYGPAAPQCHRSKLFEGPLIEANEFGLGRLFTHGDPGNEAWRIDARRLLKLIMNAAVNTGKSRKTKAVLFADFHLMEQHAGNPDQQRTILGESMPLVALRVSTINCD